MKTIRNNIIPFPGYKAITFWPFVFVRKKAIYKDVDERHEEIHGRQQLEMLLLLFFLWYLIEWLVRIVQYKNCTTAYKNISFEREAYTNQNDVCYLDSRKHYAWIHYLKLG